MNCYLFLHQESKYFLLLFRRQMSLVKNGFENNLQRLLDLIQLLGSLSSFKPDTALFAIFLLAKTEKKQSFYQRGTKGGRLNSKKEFNYTGSLPKQLNTITKAAFAAFHSRRPLKQSCCVQTPKGVQTTQPEAALCLDSRFIVPPRGFIITFHFNYREFLAIAALRDFSMFQSSFSLQSFLDGKLFFPSSGALYISTSIDKR